MEDMEFEFLIRRIYKTGRDYFKGADADIYREMERAQREMEIKSWNLTQQEREYDYRSKFIEVRRIVKRAINDGLDKIRNRADNETVNVLEGFLSTLRRDFYDKDKLDEIISRADEIFESQGLEE